MRNHYSPVLTEPEMRPPRRPRLVEGGQLVPLIATYEERIALYRHLANRDVSLWDEDEDGERP